MDVTTELFSVPHATMIAVPGGFTCPRCFVRHHMAYNKWGRTWCLNCLPHPTQEVFA